MRSPEQSLLTKVAAGGFHAPFVFVVPFRHGFALSSLRQLAFITFHERERQRLRRRIRVVVRNERVQ
jgi:hypothetical protein